MDKYVKLEDVKYVIDDTVELFTSEYESIVNKLEEISFYLPEEYFSYTNNEFVFSNWSDEVGLLEYDNFDFVLNKEELL